MPDASYARDLYAKQMAIIAGSFPLKAQVEEFQKSLKLDNMYKVYEQTITQKKGNQDVSESAFRFLGFEVERRTIGPDGNPVGNWQPLDFQTPYNDIVRLVAQEFAPEDQKLEPLLVRGLYMRRPVQIPVKEAGKEGPKANKPYPEPEKDLPKIEKTLTGLTPKQTAQPAGSDKFNTDKFDPFTGETAPPSTTPEQPTTPQDWSPPEYCVLRFIDVTVKAGQTYEYRMKVKMANPNHNKPDAEVAYHDLTVPKELKSDDWHQLKDPSGKPLRVSVPTDLHFYAVDEQALRKKDYKGLNSGKGYDSTHQAVVQIHTWMDKYEKTRGKKTYFYPVGDWVVGERLFVYRGESLSAESPAHVPIWSAEQSTFTLAGKPPVRGPDRKPVEEVHFMDPERAPMLVDFEGGTVSYHRPAQAVLRTAEEGAAAEPAKPTPAADIRATGASVELLFLTPDGKLVGRDSAGDENDEDRKARERSYTERVEEATGKPPEPGNKPMT
jgi:hypothetical protein